ncbi:hypothetical protein PMAYCL1PPCAC_10988, partial [Pristionchus mayeri]
VSAVSGISQLSGLSVRTDYAPADLERLNLERFMANEAQVDEESLQDKQIRSVVHQYPPEKIFEWAAIEVHPEFRGYRKMVLRVC